MYLDIPYVEYDDQETDEIFSVAFLLESDIVEFNIDASRFERVIVLPTSLIVDYLTQNKQSFLTCRLRQSLL